MSSVAVRRVDGGTGALLAVALVVVLELAMSLGLGQRRPRAEVAGGAGGIDATGGSP